MSYVKWLKGDAPHYAQFFDCTMVLTCIAKFLSEVELVWGLDYCLLFHSRGVAKKFWGNELKPPHGLRRCGGGKACWANPKLVRRASLLLFLFVFRE